MVKRAKLTLDQPEVVTEVLRPSLKSRPNAKLKKQTNMGAAIVLAGLTIASLVIFKQKIF